MKQATDLMTTAESCTPDFRVKKLASLLLQSQLDGVCVCDWDGKLVGVVTAMDLIFKEKRLNLPTYISIFEAVVPLTGVERMRAELEKISSVTVAQLMSHDPIFVKPTDRLDTIASLMVEKHLTILPVVDDEKVVGMITKASLLRATYSPYYFE